MDFGRVSSQHDPAMTSRGLFQRMSAPQRKIKSCEDDHSGFSVILFELFKVL